MAWIWLAFLGQFLNAIVAILDKYIVSDSSAIPRPFVYAFYSCLLAGVWLFIFAFGLIPTFAGWGLPQLRLVTIPSLELVSMAFLAAYAFFLALVSMFDALKHDTPSNVMPVVGAVAAIASLGLNYLFLDAVLTENFLLGIALLAIGTLLVSQASFNRALILMTFHSGIFFALHLVTMKGLFEKTDFDNAFFWSRVALVLFALSLLLVPAYLKKIHDGTANTTKTSAAIVLLTKLIAGIAAFLLLKATDWGEVSVVQALDGLKFVFILILSYVVTLFVPHLQTERGMKPKEVIRKVLYVTLIALGFIVLFL